jgi:hypothetical protein
MACGLKPPQRFCDENRIELYDSEHSTDEERYNTQEKRTLGAFHVFHEFFLHKKF